MVFRISTLSMLVGALLPWSGEAYSSDLQKGSLDNTSATSSFMSESTTAKNLYTVSLSRPGAFHDSYKLANISPQQAVNEILEQQTQIKQAIANIAPMAKVSLELRITANILYVTMTAKEAEQVLALNEVVLVTLDKENVTDNHLAAKVPEFHNLKVNDAKGNVVVSIIGPGVDYSHKALGGEGKPDSYSEAFQNVSNAWDGFPNDVVIGGFDFVSEQGTFDYNPIEYASDYVDSYRDYLTYTAGLGTMAASLIRDANPNAKILAYKTNGVTFSNTVVTGTRKDFAWALEMSMDPNLDGDMSDAADIILLAGINSFSGYYKHAEMAISPYSAEIDLLRGAAGSGALVVTTAGNNSYLDEDFKTQYIDNFYNIGYRGVTPEALTIGYSKKVDNQYFVSPDSPLGPTRGDSILKPDVLALNEEFFGAMPGSGTGYHKLENDHFLAAARAAATAASIKANHPQLLPHELKALIVNTGQLNLAFDKEIFSDVEERKIIDNYGPAHVGGGTINALAANKSYALMYDEKSLQANLFPGIVGVYDNISKSHKVVIKNLTAETQVYTSVVEHIKSKTSPAVRVIFPEMIVLDPHEEKTISVSIMVNGDLLPNNPIKEGAEFNASKIQEMAASGYIKLHHESNAGATIHLPWMIMPYRQNSFSADRESSIIGFYRGEEFYEQNPKAEVFAIYHDFDYSDGADFDMEYFVTQIELTNNSSDVQKLWAMPLIYQANSKPEHLIGNHGIIIKKIAGTLLPESQCKGGQKLTLAFEFFDKFQMPYANHYERSGADFMNIHLYNDIAIEAAEDSNFDLVRNTNKQNKITEITVSINNEANGVESRYIDLSLAQDSNDPFKRIKLTNLPVIASPGGDSVMVNICTDELYHDNIDASTFEKHIAVFVETDRHSLPGIESEPLVHNFKKSGVITNYNAAPKDPDEEPEEVEVLECPNGFIFDDNENCLRVYNSTTIETLIDYLHGEGTNNQNEVFAPESFDYSCESADLNGTKECQLEHLKFIEPVTMLLPENEAFNGDVLCEFAIDPEQPLKAKCIANSTQSDWARDESFYNYIDFNVLLTSKDVGEYGEARSFNSGIAIKMAKGSIENVADLEWHTTLSIEPKEKLVVSFFADSACADTLADPIYSSPACLAGAVINPNDGTFLVATTYSQLPAIAPEQSFSVAENAENGTVIGRLAYNNELLIPENKKDLDIVLVSNSHGAPFQIDDDGVISVRDSSLLDYEKMRTYKIAALPVWGKIHGQTVSLTIDVNNVNDSAPNQTADLPTINATQGKEIEHVNLRSYFLDPDNNSYVFNSYELPKGLILTPAGLLHGTPTESGITDITIYVYDGKFEYLSRLSFNIKASSNIADNDEGSDGDSGGSASYLILLTMLFLSRRKIIQ